MPTTVTLCATLVLSWYAIAHGHGRLTKPTPRNGGTNPSGLENAPASVSDATATNFICRHPTRNLQVHLTDVTAGGTLTLQWTTVAAHVGDCALYISYDVNEDLVNQRYFKIANFPDCKSKTNTDVTITIPDFLPAGLAIMRWDWYALHVRPTIEFYTQCVDIQVTGSPNSVQPSQISAYTITNPPIYPSTGNEGVGFRNAFMVNTEQYMTGPACANGITINDCPLTAVGTTGNTHAGGNTGTSPTPTTTATGTTTTATGPTTTATVTTTTATVGVTTPNPGNSCATCSASSCKSKNGPNAAPWATDDACGKCAPPHNYQWWPCDLSDGCHCTDDVPVPPPVPPTPTPPFNCTGCSASSCKSVNGPNAAPWATDDACGKCGSPQNYQWWPCDLSDGCHCTGDAPASMSPSVAAGDAPTPVPAPVPMHTRAPALRGMKGP